jgi:hypothetical protein
VQASLYGQVVKWFQNHSYNEKKCVNKRRRAAKVVDTYESDDDEAIQSHLSELQKELKKKKQDYDKIVRLLSLTFSCRKGDTLSRPANTRITSTLKNYPCLKDPIFVSEFIINPIYLDVVFSS